MANPRNLLRRLLAAVQPTDVIGVLLAALVLGAFLAPTVTVWVCLVIVVAWAICAVVTIGGGLLLVHLAERQADREEREAGDRS